MIAFRYVLCVALVVVGLSDVQSALSKEEMSKIYEEILPHIVECSTEYGLAEDTLKTAKEEHNIEGINSCFFACIFKKIEIMDDKGQIDTEKALEKSKKFFTTEEDLKNGAEVIEECSAVNSETVTDGEAGCDRAVLLAKCLAKHKDKFFAGPL